MKLQIFMFVCKSMYKTKNKNNEIALCLVAVILQSRCFQMSDQVPSFYWCAPDQYQICIITFFFPGPYSEITAFIAHQTSEKEFQGMVQVGIS